MINDDDLERRRTKAMEVTLDDVAGGDRLAGRILPTGSCEGALDLWGERTKHGEDREPHEEYDP